MKKTRLIKIDCDFHKDVLHLEIPVTACCKVGPITRENYCPNCGAYIDKDEPASPENSVQIVDTGLIVVRGYDEIGHGPRLVKLNEKRTWLNNVYTEEIIFDEKEILIYNLPETFKILAELVGRAQEVLNKCT